MRGSLALVRCAALGAAQDEAPAPAHPFSAEELARVFAYSPPPPPPPDPTNAWADDPAAARFGQWVFFDERFSGNGTLSCASCHDPGLGFADARPLPIASPAATSEAPVQRHTMSLWNVAHNRWFFWDGRADSLWAQALIPLEEEREHGGSRLQYAQLIARDPELRAAYEAIFGALPALEDAERFPREGRPVPEDPEHPHARAWASMAPEDRAAVDRVFVHLGKAIAAYERLLVSQPAPFDWYVGSLRAGGPRPNIFGLSAERGLKLFVGEAGCFQCHHGPLFTDYEFHDARAPHGLGGDPNDPGRYRGIELLRQSPFGVAGAHSDDPEGPQSFLVEFLSPKGHDWGVFKTPSLRNVATSAPYMHHGQFAELHDVVRFYSTRRGERSAPHADPLLRPLSLSEQEIDDLVAFLASLTNTGLPVELLRAPASPRVEAR